MEFFLSLEQKKYMNNPIGFEIVLCCVLLGKKQFVIQNLARLHKLTKGPQIKGTKSINLFLVPPLKTSAKTFTKVASVK